MLFVNQLTQSYVVGAIVGTSIRQWGSGPKEIKSPVRGLLVRKRWSQDSKQQLV